MLLDPMRTGLLTSRQHASAEADILQKWAQEPAPRLAGNRDVNATSGKGDRCPLLHQRMPSLVPSHSNGPTNRSPPCLAAASP
uniref:Uncharacterized protein n=1 Tax=Sphaerodactylus townsendi TaxID=933632 RepID=A0ACB8ECX8_9SAUR